MKRSYLLLLFGIGGTAAAQSSDISSARLRDIWVNVGWSAMSTSYIGTDQLTGGSAHDLQVKSGAVFAVRFDLSQGEHIGYEFQYRNSRMPLQYNYAQGAPQLQAAINEGGYSFVAYLNGRESRARFFGTAGLQVTDFVRPSDSAIGCESANCTVASQPPTTGGNFKVGFNYGAGAKIRIKSRYGVRFDVRQYVSGKPFNLPLSSGLLSRTEISAGFGVSF